MKETNCGHPECKNFYMINKQMCMFDNNQPQLSNLLKNSNSLFQPQVQVKTLLPQPININNIGQQIINSKRSSSPLNDDEHEDSLMKKKIKSEPVGFTAAGFQPVADEESLRQMEQKQPFIGDLQSKLSEISKLSQLQGNAIPNSLLSSLIGAQGANPSPQGDVSFSSVTQNGIVVPIIQNSQANLGLLNNLPNTTVLPVQQNGMNPLSQLLAQSMKMNPAMNAQPQPNNNILFDNKSKSDANFCNEAFLKDFQARTFNLLFTQNKMLTDLREKNDMLQDTLACLINEINLLKNTVKQTHHEAPAATMANSHHPISTYQNIGNSSETMTVESLISFLYGPNPDFGYQLVLKHDLPLPLYRERNFKFTVILTDKNGNPVENTNRIPLTIGIYSSENPPKFIDSNTAGNKILKGFIDKDLVNGSVTFDKVQIKEVTSHFRNGWVFFVVYPKIAGQSGASVLGNTSMVINGQKIKPLILEKVVVKAKKAKEKDQGNDNENEDKMNEEKLEKEEDQMENIKEDSDN